MVALAREIGSRGRADAVPSVCGGGYDDALQPCPEPEAGSGRSQALRVELAQLKPSVLKKRAKAVGAAAEEIEGAEDAEDPKTALIAIIIACEGGRMAELASMRPSALKKRAKAVGATDAEIEEAEDADETTAARHLYAYPNATGSHMGAVAPGQVSNHAAHQWVPKDIQGGDDASVVRHQYAYPNATDSQTTGANPRAVQ